jgi:mannosidase alpha-like ER degradation enhancer 1
LQLFDEDNPLHKSENKYIFTTEGHIVPIDQRFREKQWEDLFPLEEGETPEDEPQNPPSNTSNVRREPIMVAFSHVHLSC